MPQERHEPPEKKPPVVLAPGISWSGVGAVFAIPVLLLYSTGPELLILFRSKQQQRNDIDDIRAVDDQLNGPKVRSARSPTTTRTRSA